MERPPALPGAPTPGYAIVEAFNPSVLGGKAVGASLFGLENRWGKLPITMYPHDYIKQQSMTNYDMSVSPGRTYKYYQGTPLFPFGFGLSLTNFKLSSCSKSGSGVRCTLTNTGSRTGDEVVQLYHTAKTVGKVDHPLPKKALVDFTRVTLTAGSSTTVSFDFNSDVFKVVNKDGIRKLYPGLHALTITRGVTTDEQVLDYIIPKENAEFVV